MAEFRTNWLVALGVATALCATPVLAQDKSSKMHEVMAKHMKEMQQMKMTGNVDRDFVMMMKHHHGRA